jgi:hypothetical protein
MKQPSDEIYKEGDYVFFTDTNTAYIVDSVKPTITGRGQLLNLNPMWPINAPTKSIWSGHVSRITADLYRELKNEWTREAYLRDKIWSEMLENN